MLPSTRDGWTLVQRGFDRTSFQAWETLCTLGSGGLHVRGSLEEPLSDCPQHVEYVRLPANVTSEAFRETVTKWGTYVPGVFGPHPLLNNEMINLPWMLELTPVVDGERLDLAHCEVHDFRRELHLDTAELTRTLCWRTRSGRTVEVAWRRFVSLARPNLCCQQVRVRCDGPAVVRVEAGLDADVRTNGRDHFAAVRLLRMSDAGFACSLQTDAGDDVQLRTEVCAVRRASETGTTDEQQRTRRRIDAGDVQWAYRAAARRAGVVADVPPHVEAVEKYTAIRTARDPQPCDVDRTLSEARQNGYEALLSESAACWKSRWSACNVEIDGDPESQVAMRAALYHLLRCRTDRPQVAIDAKGYTSDAYWGRFFWDTEMCLLPFFLYTQPDAARMLVDFRVNTLEGAIENARRYGYAGARYAWESDADGRECCPNWQYADHEVHVTADVVYGLAHYAAASGDETYLRGPAARVVVETARYWMARVDWRDRDAAAHRRIDEEEGAGPCRVGIQEDALTPVLLGVMGPDEYTPISSNNAFTNRMVRFALELAARVGDSGGASADERRDFAEVAARLPIPRDPDDPRLVLQCDEFPSLAEPRFERFWKDRAKTFASQVSQERLYRSKCLKQADVLMLMMLFPHEFSDAEVQRAWDYYLPYTTHDSSLSPGVHALVACRLGRVEDAWRFWQRCCAVDFDVAAGGAREGMHIANCGLMWQIVAFGFAGVRTAMQCQSLTLTPRLPQRWRRVRFPLVWRGQALTVDVSTERVEVTSRGWQPLRVTVWGEARVIAAGASSTWTGR